MKKTIAPGARAGYGKHLLSLFVKQGLFILLMAVLFTSDGLAQSSDVFDLRTGWTNPPTNSSIAPGSSDDTWTVNYNGITATPKVCDLPLPAGTWVSGNPAFWVTPLLSTTPGSLTRPSSAMYVGTYTYSTKCTIPSVCQIQSAVLNIERIAADNILEGIYVNGTSVYSSIPNPTGDPNDYYSSMITTLGTVDVTPYLTGGVNTVAIKVINNESYTGLFVKGNLTVNYVPLVPYIAGRENYCAGTAPYFDGSTSAPTGGSPSHHKWAIQETDGAGNPVAGGYASGDVNWVYGAPGSKTFPSTLPCGRYYTVTLKVKNQCTDSAATTKLIYVACNPSGVSPAPITVCEGTCVQIGVKMVFGESYKWTQAVGPFVFTLGTTPKITVCPTANSTYTLTTTNLYGCTSVRTYTVNVTPNDPSFTLTVNTITPGSTYWLKGIATDPNGLSRPGFLYEWIVEELDASNATVYTNMGYATSSPYNNCWWTYPSDQVFAGFTAGVGIFTQTNGCTPAQGVFRYDKKYRITRATWDNACPRNAYSLIVDRGVVQAPTLRQSETGTATDAAPLQNREETPADAAAHTLTLYPNPSDGAFTVVADVPAGTLEVTDVLGRRVWQTQTNGLPLTVDLSTRPKGIYIVNLHANGQTHSQKIILQ